MIDALGFRSTHQETRPELVYIFRTGATVIRGRRAQWASNHAAEFRDLFERAGFALEQIVPTPSPLSIVIGRPLM